MVYKIKFYSSDETVKLEYTKNVGLDIKSIEDIKLKPNGITKVKTGIHICNNIVKNNWYETNQTFFKVEGRSGLASNGIFPVGGIIDENYRGEICVLLYNTNEIEYEVKKYDRIAQLVAYQYTNDISVEMTNDKNDIIATDRNDKGFGSSGK